MPLPVHPLTIRGGCFCRAVRYVIEIPELEQRPVHPWASSQDPADATACRLPFATWCQCNFCRAATGALLPAAICVPANMMTVTCVVVDSTMSPSEKDRNYADSGITVPVGQFPRSRASTTDVHAESTITRPGLDLLAPPFSGASNATRTWIRSYGTSESRTRSFCGRCGTCLAYNVRPMPEPWSDMLDVWLGTVDREDLELVNEQGIGFLEPERQLWWERGLPWLRRATWTFAGPKHEASKPDKEIQSLHE